MITWFKDKNIEIMFDDLPSIGIRYILPSMTADEKKSIKKYPFINKRELKVCLIDIKNKKSYDFVIPKGYCYDGASIPRFFWRIVGANTDNKFLVAALVHDVLCENHNFIENDRKFSTEVFDALLKVSDVNKVTRFLMKKSVDIFQKRFCDWSEKGYG